MKNHIKYRVVFIVMFMLPITVYAKYDSGTFLGIL